jgi:hypothetical protein
MLSLTLSDDKVYCLGSDYCTDLVRAFHVIPVNIELMNTLSVDMLPEGGVDKDGNAIVKDADETNIQYFYEIVWAGNWTFDILAKYSRAIFADAGTEVEGGKSGADITDRLGFAISTNGIPSSGILYTSTVEILDKKSLTDAERAAALSNEKDAPLVLEAEWTSVDKNTPEIKLSKLGTYQMEVIFKENGIETNRETFTLTTHIPEEEVSIFSIGDPLDVEIPDYAIEQTFNIDILPWVLLVLVVLLIVEWGVYYRDEH